MLNPEVGLLRSAGQRQRSSHRAYSNELYQDSGTNVTPSDKNLRAMGRWPGLSPRPYLPGQGRLSSTQKMLPTPSRSLLGRLACLAMHPRATSDEDNLEFCSFLPIVSRMNIYRFRNC